MKRKNLNVLRLNNFFLKDKKSKEIYLKFNNILSKNKKNKRFVVAISGGPDSLALAALSNIFSHKKKFKFFFVLIDHGIRKNSSKEASEVKKLLKKHSIQLKIIKNNKKIFKNFQKSARDIRYKLLSDYCKKNNAKSLLVAHHQDDQVETFLIRLSRGSGVEGLSSMSELSKIKGNINLISH